MGPRTVVTFRRREESLATARDRTLDRQLWLPSRYIDYADIDSPIRNVVSRMTLLLSAYTLQGTGNKFPPMFRGAGGRIHGARTQNIMM